MRLHYKIPRWVNSARVETEFTKSNFYCSVSMGIFSFEHPKKETIAGSLAFMLHILYKNNALEFLNS